MLAAIKIVLGVALVLVVFAAAVVGAPIVASKFTWVVIAQVDLSAGMRLGEGLAWLKLWPVATVPSGATHTLEDVFGKYLLSNKNKGDIISPSDVTDIKPPPRRQKSGYALLGFGVSRDDAAKLQVGDVVDVTLSFSDRPTITLREDWVIAIIDYEDPLTRSFGGVKVSLEMKYENLIPLIPVMNRNFDPSGMVKRYPDGK